MLHLIKMWLEAPVEETDEKGNKHRSTRNRDEGKGTPQGAPISPLLSNLYMRRFVLGWKKLGHEKRLAAHIVNYADDLVICCRGQAEEALARMRDIMTKLKLTVNETKTRVCKLPEEKFDFLGYTFGRCYSPKTGRAYIGTVPSKKRVIRICEAISEMTGRNQTQLAQEMVVAKLNRTVIGWANYFCLGPVSKASPAVAVLVVDVRPIGTEVFVHLTLRTVNPCNRVGRPFSILINVPVMSPYSVKIFSGYYLAHIK
jgi:RNA-directed DNA polymerase